MRWLPSYRFINGEKVFLECYNLAGKNNALLLNHVIFEVARFFGIVKLDHTIATRQTFEHCS